MEYHSDRFQDASLLIYKKSKLFAILPAHRKEDVLFSHLGLTYGGLICSASSTSEIDACFRALIDFLKSEKFKQLGMKVMPAFLQQNHSSALEYFLHHEGAQLKRRDLNFVVDLSSDIKFHKSKRKKLATIDKDALNISEVDSCQLFWNEILIPVLKESHGVAPVHSTEEITQLKNSFPKHIIQYNVKHQGTIVAGMTLFIDNGVVKSQYGAANTMGKELRALDALYEQLFVEYKAAGFRYFDMGTTTVNGGKDYNTGLTRYKEEFGATPINLDYYMLTL